MSAELVAIFTSTSQAGRNDDGSLSARFNGKICLIFKPLLIACGQVSYVICRGVPVGIPTAASYRSLIISFYKSLVIFHELSIATFLIQILDDT